MKSKQLITLLIAAAAACAAGLTACSKGDAPTHAYGEEWFYTDGSGHYHKCADDGCNAVSGTEAHTYGEASVTPSTCTVAGSRTVWCTVCGYSYTENLPLAAHGYGAWTVGTQPTATDGGTAKRVCTAAGCGAEDEDKLDLPALESGEYTVTDSTATCTAAGTATYTYSKNGVTVVFTAPSSAGHKYVADYVWDGADNLTVKLTCSVCDMQEIDLTDIAYETDTRAADCTAGGYEKKTGTATYDGQTFSDTKILSETPVLAHVYSYVIAYDETQHWQRCINCNGRNPESVADHDFVNNVRSDRLTVRPTATEQGVRRIQCSCKYEKDFPFDGIVSSCNIASFKLKSGKDVPYTDGMYYYVNNNDVISLSFSDLSDGATAINAITFEYSPDGINYLTAPTTTTILTQPVAYYYDGSGVCTLRFYQVDETGADGQITKVYKQVYLRASIYVTEQSIAVEKEFVFAPAPAQTAAQAYVFDESKLVCEWQSLGLYTMYVGQEYRIKAPGGYTVSADGQSVTLNADGEGAFVPSVAGTYTVTAASLYNSAKSYTATLTVKEAPDCTAKLSGSYTGNDYTVAFGEGNTITVSKDGEADVTLSYTFADGVLTTSGSNDVSVSITPSYKMMLTAGEDKCLLTKVYVTTNAVRSVLGGTSWTKCVYDPVKVNTTYSVTITVSFNADGTGTLVRTMDRYSGTVKKRSYVSTLNFTYAGAEVDGTTKLIFTYADSSEYTNENHVFEVGKGESYTDNDFSVINYGEEDSTVSADGTCLTLWLKTGHYNASASTGQAVVFDRVTAS